jgi:hypothetical protein
VFPKRVVDLQTELAAEAHIAGGVTESCKVTCVLTKNTKADGFWGREVQHLAPLKTLINKKFWEELIAYFPLIRHGPHR